MLNDTLKTARKFAPVLLTGLLMLPLTPVAAQELIVESDPEITIVLDGTVRILSDGTVRAATSQAPEEFCPATESCEGVLVDLDFFTANGETTTLQVNQGDSVRFDWGSLGARRCTAGGELPEWTGEKGIEGPQSITIASDRAPGVYAATMQCENGSVDSGVPRQVDVDVREFIGDPGAPEHCDATRQMPSSWNRLAQCEYFYGWTSSDCRYFEGIEPWGSPFIEQSGVGADLGIKRANDYIAIAFSTEGLNATATGSIQVNRPRSSASFNNNRKLMSISSCPGDFNQTAIAAETGCLKESFTANLDWGGPSAGRNCTLQSGEIYYLNIIFTNSAVGTPNNEIEPNPDCDEGAPYCGSSFFPNINN